MCVSCFRTQAVILVLFLLLVLLLLLSRKAITNSWYACNKLSLLQQYDACPSTECMLSALKEVLLKQKRINKKRGRGSWPVMTIQSNTANKYASRNQARVRPCEKEKIDQDDTDRRKIKLFPFKSKHRKM